MGLGDNLKSMFKRKKSLEKVSVDELRKEKIALEQQEVKFTKQIGQIEGKKKEEVHRILADKCTKCGACRTVCPLDAISTV